MSRLLLACSLISPFHQVLSSSEFSNELNTNNDQNFKNLFKIICPFLSTLINEGVLPVQDEYTKKDLEDITFAAGLDRGFIDEIHIMLNFANNPSGKQDIFNMEGATNEHVSSTGINDCPTSFTDCQMTSAGLEQCKTKTDDPDCGVPSKDRFDRFVEICDENEDKYITQAELERCVDHLPFVDANPIAEETIFGSFSTLIQLFGTTAEEIHIDDLERVFIKRRFPLISGYFFGRTPVTPPSTGGHRDSCFPGSAQIFSAARGAVRVSDVEPSELVLVQSTSGDLRYEPVLGFLHEVRGAQRSYATIALSDGAVFRASENHMVFKRGEDGVVQDIAVGQLAAGMKLLALEPEAHGRYVLGIKRRVDNTGLFAPVTASGTVVVDGYIASAYAKSEMASAVSHSVMHASMFLVRMAHLTPSSFDVSGLQAKSLPQACLPGGLMISE